MQINADKLLDVGGVITQGRRDADQWVTEYQVKTTKDGSTWTSVGTFSGNSDRNTKVKQMFAKPVEAKAVRFVVKKWRDHACMRAALLVCPGLCLHRLFIPFAHSRPLPRALPSSPRSCALATHISERSEPPLRLVGWRAARTCAQIATTLAKSTCLFQSACSQMLKGVSAARVSLAATLLVAQ